MEQSHTFAGIDVSKDRLHLALTTSLQKPDKAPVTQWSNDEQGLKELIEVLHHEEVDLVVCESSGDYEFQLLLALQKAQIPWARVKPNDVRFFAKGLAKHAKTDIIDARVIAYYGAVCQPQPQHLGSAAQQEVRLLFERDRDLAKSLTQNKNRLQQFLRKLDEGHCILQQLQEDIERIESQRKDLQRRLQQLLLTQEQLRYKAEKMSQIKGLGPMAIMALLALLPELGRKDVSLKQLYCLLGCAPLNWQSGKMDAKRRTRRGRAQLAAVLYFPIISVINHQPGFQQYAQALASRDERGLKNLDKPAIRMASMRKLIAALHIMIRDDLDFDPRKVTSLSPPQTPLQEPQRQ